MKDTRARDTAQWERTCQAHTGDGSNSRTGKRKRKKEKKIGETETKKTQYSKIKDI